VSRKTRGERGALSAVRGCSLICELESLLGIPPPLFGQPFPVSRPEIPARLGRVVGAASEFEVFGGWVDFEGVARGAALGAFRSEDAVLAMPFGAVEDFSPEGGGDGACACLGLLQSTTRCHGWGRWVCSGIGGYAVVLRPCRGDPEFLSRGALQKPPLLRHPSSTTELAGGVWVAPWISNAESDRR
jgi:hypothetical protein